MFNQDKNDHKSYEYDVSLIDIHIIYIYIYINIIKIKLYTIKYVKLNLKLLRYYYFNFEIRIKSFHIKTSVINILNFCYKKYKNVNKIIWVGSVNNKYLYKNILYICQYH